jgi:tetratricopeptide (TPR) repeat protein
MDQFLGPYLTNSEWQEQIAWRNQLLDNPAPVTATASESDKEKLIEEDRAIRLQVIRLYRAVGSLDKAQESLEALRKLYPPAAGNETDRLYADREELLIEQAKIAIDSGSDGVRLQRQAERLAQWIADFRRERRTFTKPAPGNLTRSEIPHCEFGKIASRVDKRSVAQTSRLFAETHLLPANLKQEDLETALRSLQEAYELSPEDPFILGAILEVQLALHIPVGNLVKSHRPHIDQAIHRCKNVLLEMGMELPMCVYLCARLQLLLELDQPISESSREAFKTYCLGLALNLKPRTAVHAELFLRREKRFLKTLCGAELAEESRRVLVEEVKELFALADIVNSTATSDDEVLIIAGANNEAEWKKTPEDTKLLCVELIDSALKGFRTNYTGSVIFGGTHSGISEMVFETGWNGERVGASIGCSPDDCNRLDSIQPRKIKSNLGGVLNYFRYILETRKVHRDNVSLIGFGGGPLAALEYRISAALGIRTGILAAADHEGLKLLCERYWCAIDNLVPLVPDPATYWCFVRRAPKGIYHPDVIQTLAVAIHVQFNKNWREQGLVNETARKEFEDLSEDLKDSNRDQARWIPLLLQTQDYKVVELKDEHKKDYFKGSTAPEFIGEIEHGRWCCGRLLSGSRLGPMRDDKAKIHPDLVPYNSAYADWLRDEDGKPFDAEVQDRMMNNFEANSRSKDEVAVREWSQLLRGLGYAIVK